LATMAGLLKADPSGGLASAEVTAIVESN